jgi:hypothetical protein
MDFKEQFIAAHEEEINDYLDRHPHATYGDAYDRTADRAYDRMKDNLADKADNLRLQKKEGN